MDDLGLQFEDLEKRAHSTLLKFPLLAANTGKNFFQQRFNAQNWIDNTTEPWRKRKKGAKRDTGRAILTDTGRLKRGTRIKQADWSAVIVGNDVPYAEAHNSGFRGVVTVNEHTRVATRKVGTKELKLKGRQRKARIGGRKVKIKGASHQVSSHTRKINLPKRQFIGNSAYLNRNINRVFIYELNKI